MKQDKIFCGTLLSYYGGMLNEHQHEVLRLYYDCDMSLAEIADDLNITRQGVREVIVRSTKKLVEFENKLGLVAKIKNISTQLNEVLDNDSLPAELRVKLSGLLTDIKEI